MEVFLMSDIEIARKTKWEVMKEVEKRVGG